MIQCNLNWATPLAAVGAPEHSIGLKNSGSCNCMLPLEKLYNINARPLQPRPTVSAGTVGTYRLYDRDSI